VAGEDARVPRVGCKGTICYTKKQKKFIIQGNILPFVSPKILSLGKAKEKRVFLLLFARLFVSLHHHYNQLRQTE